MAKSPIDRLSLRWKFPDDREVTVNFVEWTERLLGQLHETLADPATDAAQRRRVKKQIRETKKRLELMGALSKAVQSVTEKDTAAKVKKINRDNAKQPRPAARLISPADAKEKWKEFLRQGSPELAAVKFTEYFGDPGRYEPESPPSKRTIARALEAVGYIQQK